MRIDIFTFIQSAIKNLHFGDVTLQAYKRRY